MYTRVHTCTHVVHTWYTRVYTHVYHVCTTLHTCVPRVYHVCTTYVPRVYHVCNTIKAPLKSSANKQVTRGQEGHLCTLAIRAEAEVARPLGTVPGQRRAEAAGSSTANAHSYVCAHSRLFDHRVPGTQRGSSTRPIRDLLIIEYPVHNEGRPLAPFVTC